MPQDLNRQVAEFQARIAVIIHDTALSNPVNVAVE